MFNYYYNGGETGIRTLEPLARLTVFKTVAFDHSAISPQYSGIIYNHLNTQYKSKHQKVIPKNKKTQPKSGSKIIRMIIDLLLHLLR